MANAPSGEEWNPRGLHKRFPDLTTENFDSVKVHNSVSILDPVVNYARQRYALVVLKLDVPPYLEFGAIFVRPCQRQPSDANGH